MDSTRQDYFQKRIRQLDKAQARVQRRIRFLGTGLRSLIVMGALVCATGFTVGSTRHTPEHKSTTYYRIAIGGAMTTFWGLVGLAFLFSVRRAVRTNRKRVANNLEYWPTMKPLQRKKTFDRIMAIRQDPMYRVLALGLEH